MNSTLNVMKGRNRQDSNASGASVDGEDIDEGNRSIIMDIIGQLRAGTDFHKVTLPTFILEPRSMCERLSDFFCFQEYLTKALEIADPAERILQLTRWVLSGHHTRPKGVKKPFNPILGEFFRCEWKEQDGTTGFYICEQVSHHPPQSIFFYANPALKIWIVGDLRPHARFLGNSAGTMMEGGSTIYLGDGLDEYFLTNPNVYARSILFGKMFMELGDNCVITSRKHNVECTLEFKQKGFFGGSEKDGVAGKIVSGKETLYKISGKWSGTTIAESKATSKESIVFDGSRDTPGHVKIVNPENEQEEFESRRLWKHVAAAVSAADHRTATEEKSKIETNQRKLVKSRSDKGIAWEPRFFVQSEPKHWVPVIFKRMKEESLTITDEIMRDFIFSKPVKDIHKSFWVKGISDLEVQNSGLDLSK